MSRETGETALLTRRHGTTVVCLDKDEADGRGYLMSRGALDPDAIGIAAPVRDADGAVTAAVSVVAVAGRVSTPHLSDLISAVRQAASTLSSQLALVAS